MFPALGLIVSFFQKDELRRQGDEERRKLTGSTVTMRNLSACHVDGIRVVNDTKAFAYKDTRAENPAVHMAAVVGELEKSEQYVIVNDEKGFWMENYCWQAPLYIVDRRRDTLFLP
jgi:hypothetical protein